MRKVLFYIFFIFLSFNALAQLEVQLGSFKEVPGFVNINPDSNYQTDDNDLPFAVIKVRTENITDKQRRELRFEGNGGTFIMLEYKTGEVWVYLTAKYADYIKISHPDFSSIEFTLPFDLQPKKGYELLLVNKTIHTAGSGILTVTSKPESGATISINGKVLKQTTPYTNDMIAAGEYEITVSKYGFEKVSKTVIINDGVTTDLSIEMPYLYGKLNVVSKPSEAVVFIDNIEYGVTPLVLNNIKFGTHEIKVKKDNWISYKNNINITNDSLSTLNIVLKKYPEGAINVAFSVSDEKQVFFSKGNLQYQASTNSWRFATHQYDYIGTSNQNILSTQIGWIDLFGWGTGNNPTYESSYSFWDWGNNLITEDENIKWRTLNETEWKYVFEIRKTKSGIRYAKAMVNGIKGVILLPDNWNSTYYRLNGINNNDSNFNSNKITATDWNSIFESKGAVFLPAAGMRYKTTIVLSEYEVKYVGTNGYYWSASGTTLGSMVFFNKNEIKPNYYDHKSYGCSVRLVCDAE